MCASRWEKDCYHFALEAAYQITKANQARKQYKMRRESVSFCGISVYVLNMI